MKKIFTLFIFFFLLGNSFGQSENDFDNDLKLLFDVTNVVAISDQVMNQMMDVMKSYYPEIPNEFWLEIEKEVDGGKLVDLMLPIYKKYYTHEDIKGLLAFYETSVGKKSIEVMPNVMQESMEIGMQYGEILGAEIRERIAKEGY